MSQVDLHLSQNSVISFRRPSSSDFVEVVIVFKKLADNAELIQCQLR